MSVYLAENAVAATTELMRRVNREIRSELKKTCKKIIKQTPVDTGRLKNNWYASNRRVGVRTTKATDKSGKKSIARVEKTLARLKVGQRFHFFNNLPYARVVEFGLYPNPPKNPTGKTVNGFSKQAPQGMLRIHADGFALAMNKKRIK